MKKVLLTFLFTIVVNSLLAQKLAVTFYDSLWLLTSRSDADFYRVGLIDTTEYLYYGEVKEFYIDGTMLSKGFFDANSKEGEFLFYYPNGQLKTKGFYKDNFRYGLWTFFYENGQVKDKIIFYDAFVGVLESYDSSGTAMVTNGTGKWGIKYVEDFANTQVTIQGEFKDSLRHGTWNYFERTLTPGIEGRSNIDRLQCVEEYSNGRFLNGKYYWGGGGVEELGGSVIDILPESERFRKMAEWQSTWYASIESYPYLKFLPELDSSRLPLDSFAQFPGGLDSLQSHFRSEMTFSKLYIQTQKERLFMVTIATDKQGLPSITSNTARMALSAYPTNQQFYNKAMKAIKKLPTFKPALRDGREAINYFDLVVRMEEGVIYTRLDSRNDLSTKN